MDLFSTMDYRAYLKDYYAAQKGNNPHFSFRFFARLAGFTSPGYLKMVMDGERNLSPASIGKCVKALKLSMKEASYFEALVLFNQASGDEERDHYFERLSALRPTTRLTGLQKDQLGYFTQKHYVVIREMIALPDFEEDPAWIAKRMNPPIKPKEAEEALQALERLGLIKRDPTGKLVQVDTSLRTDPEVNSIHVFHFHRGMLNDAKEAMLTVPAAGRDITALTIPIPKASLPTIKKRIQEFRESIVHYVNEGDQNFDEVYQLNIQLFPVTRIVGGKRGKV